MISIIITILLIAGVFKLTGLIFKLCGKLIGGVFGLIGYLIVGVLAIAGFGIAVAFLPVIIIAAIVAIVAGVSKARI